MDVIDQVRKKIYIYLHNILLESEFLRQLILQVLLVGAGTRVPKVQEKLQEFLNRELGKSLNTDEAGKVVIVK